MTKKTKPELTIVSSKGKYKLDPDQLKMRQGEYESLKQKSRDCSMEVASFGKVTEAMGIHNKAFFDVCKIARMERTKALDYLFHLDTYREILLENLERDLFETKAERKSQHEGEPGLPLKEGEGAEQDYRELGRIAGAAGKNRDSCPLEDEDSPAAQEWFEGWAAGQTAIANGLSRGGRGMRAAGGVH